MAGYQCCQNPPTGGSAHGGGVGAVAVVGGLTAYVSGGSSDSKLALILISDIFGYEAPLLRKLADKLATMGFYVLVPDFFYGDPFVWGSSFELLPAWNELHTQEKGFEDVKPIIAALKNKGISAVGAAGFCWGGKVVAELAKSDFIQAAVLLHPYLVTIEDIKEIKAPTAILGAEFDEVTPVELIKQFEDVLATRPEVKSYVKIFEGATHGWTVRYNEEDEKEVKSAQESHHIMLHWFNHYLDPDSRRAHVLLL